MRIYIQKNGIVLSGKAWEIREQLKYYSKQYQFVYDWIKQSNS
ncbi:MULTISPECIES: Z-ring formation inhibitor MciZ [Heyndrickxia]|nr:Z-ring formation inhibitor MciZ [Heyndrickxia oleronia]GIN38260.1 hypothetical protein J19TS1_12090 [Heyndrickxia oleronia]